VTPTSSATPAAARDAARDAADLLPAEARWEHAEPPAEPPTEPPAGGGSASAARAPASRSLWQRVRAVLFWLHLAAGVAAGGVILAMSATGVVLAYQRQLTEWAVGRQMTPAAAGAARLPLDTLVARAAAAAPAGARLATVTGRADRRAPVAVGFEGRGPGAARRTVYLDAVSGAVLPGSPRLQAFFGGAERLHRSLMIGRGTRSPQGAAVTGAANLAFFFLLLSGCTCGCRAGGRGGRCAPWRCPRPAPADARATGTGTT
jgi:uncharacterized iron-regulated membrane protein